MNNTSQPANPLIDVLGSDGRPVASTRRANATRPYALQLESEEDFKDADSILWGLKRDPGLLERFAELNTWQANPLFGIAKEDLAVLLQAHEFALPRWLREEADVRMRLTSLAEKGHAPEQPMVAIGLANRASHMALLGALWAGGLYGSVTVHANDSVEVVFATRTGKSIVASDLCFLSSEDMGGKCSAMQLSQLRQAARRGAPVLVILPTSPEGFEELLPDSTALAIHRPLPDGVGLILVAKAVEREENGANAPLRAITGQRIGRLRTG